MSYQFDWTAIWANRWLVLDGTLITIEISLVSLVLALLFGLAVGMIGASRRKFQSWFAVVYVEGLRNIPLLVHLYVWYIALASLRLPAMLCAVLGLSLYSSAYVAEVVRAGILAVQQGQIDGGLALGLKRRQVMVLIVLPQAVRNVLPSLASLASQLIKDSSLASVISVAELTFQASALESQTFRTFEIYITVALIYLVLVTIVTQTALRLVGTSDAGDRRVSHA
jgi:His/Glu/Gln/Arg/opine family amino acid ABC transporter permease subunit